jgi:hypothetical protein
MSKKAEFFTAIILLLYGSVYLLATTQYSVGRWDDPGPGLLPRMVGFVFIGLSFYLAVTFWRQSKAVSARAPASADHGLELKAPLQLVGILILYLGALPLLGFSLSTFLAVGFISRRLGLEGWKKPVMLATGTIFFIHILFVRLLDVPLPTGIIWKG